MADISSQIESAPIPSIRSLKSRFEQFALDSASAAPTSHTRSTPVLPTPVLPQSQLESAPTPCSRIRAFLAPDDCISQSQPFVSPGDVRSKVSNPDLKAAALKRPPPPPPPPRCKKRSSSPVALPLFRPVPVPAALRSPRGSPEREQLSMGLDTTRNGPEESSEEGSLGSVASLRDRFSSLNRLQTSKSSPPRPVTPKLPFKPPMTSQTDPMAIDRAPPAIPPRHYKPGVLDSCQPSSEEISAESPAFGSTTDTSPRPSKVAAMRDRFTSIIRDDHPSCRDEPTILVTSPPTLPARRPPARPLNLTLFSRGDGLDVPSSSNSSVYSPFSDEESEISELSEISLPLEIHSRKINEIPTDNDAHTFRHERKFSGSSSSSVSSISPPSKPRPPPRPAPHPPPRPPRQSTGASTLPVTHDSSTSTMATPTQPIAPPLPSRRPTQEENTSSEVRSAAPPLPARLFPPQSNTPPPPEVHSPAGEPKSTGNARLPPPPTRTIGLGDKLPPMRRTNSPSSDEESGSEEDPRIRSVESLPDSSRSSRRPPSMPSVSFMEYKIHIPAYSGHVAVAGSRIVLASGHHIKYYDLSSNDGPQWTLDTRECMRGALVSSLEFRSAHADADRARYLWVGTKEGILFEVDTEMPAVTSSKVGIHASQITNIFRTGSTMVTLDETGKTFIFDPSGNLSAGVGAGLTDDVNLVYTSPRVYRLGEKAEFVKLFGGLLWTAVRTDVHGAGTGSSPVIRIYDIYAPGSIGRSVIPSQHTGAVTSGTVLPSHPDHVYLGHEGGYITIWNVATGDGIPACVEVVKVSASDVLCLEGVNDRLWTGGRKGTISVYDVSAKPWVVTNCWDAHGGLPVSRIFVDPYAVVQMDRLSVVSVGRDEQIRFWDGLLGADQIEQELLKREHMFSTFRNLKVFIVSWNVDAAKPDSLTADPENARFLHDILSSLDGPDIISFGFQEVIDLESRKMAAKTVLLGGKKKGDEGKINEKVTSSYKRWHDRLIQAVRLAMPSESPYSVIHTESLVGLFTCIFIKNTERASLKDAAIATIKRGMGGRYGNKGGIAARFVIDDSSLCFINCHLAAGQHHVRQRNSDVAAFLEEPNVFPAESVEDGFGYVGGGDGSMVLDHEIVFLNGDMNYRIDQRRDAVIAAIQANDLDALLTHDQLCKEMKHNRAFRLRSFCEGPLTFAPTYKYDRNSDVYDTSEKRRVPAWCDRVLWRSREEKRVVLMGYRRWEVNVSDHRPVSAAFRVTVKRVVGEARTRERRALEGWWRGAAKMLIEDAKQFYVAQAMV